MRWVGPGQRGENGMRLENKREGTPDTSVCTHVSSPESTVNHAYTVMKFEKVTNTSVDDISEFYRNIVVM